MKEYTMNLTLDLQKEKVLENIKEIREALEELASLAEDFNLAALHIYPSFNGCSFNFGQEGQSISKYKVGDDIYENKICEDIDEEMYSHNENCQYNQCLNEEI